MTTFAAKEASNPSVINTLNRLREFGQSGQGVNRVAGSIADVEARLWILAQLEQGGMIAEIDEVGNTLGRSAHHERAVLVGSHTDTVPTGGWLDGALGAVYGLCTALELSQSTEHTGIDAVSFADEEGSYAPCIGSRYFFGDEYSEQEFIGTASRLQLSLASLGASRPLTKRLPRDWSKRYKFFLEAHIEQGPVLEAEDIPIGIVTGIVGIRRFELTVLGRADHAGTTPMTMRSDAGRALIELLNRIDIGFEQIKASDTVWNFGVVAFSPGAPNVVPERATAVIEFRDRSLDVLAKFEATMRDMVRAQADQVPHLASLRYSLQCTAQLEPIDMDVRVIEVLSRSCDATGVAYRMMQSGAGHDAMIAARHLPAGMLFIPSIGGRSHHPAEDSRKDHIQIGYAVFREATKYLCTLDYD
jgi:beta-ureidopropionase / N-carbamoyl-L-amino-acid hydrolase